MGAPLRLLAQVMLRQAAARWSATCCISAASKRSKRVGMGVPHLKRSDAAVSHHHRRHQQRVERQRVGPVEAGVVLGVAQQHLLARADGGADQPASSGRRTCSGSDAVPRQVGHQQLLGALLQHHRGGDQVVVRLLDRRSGSPAPAPPRACGHRSAPPPPPSRPPAAPPGGPTPPAPVPSRACPTGRRDRGQQLGIGPARTASARVSYSSSTASQTAVHQHRRQQRRVVGDLALPLELGVSLALASSRCSPLCGHGADQRRRRSAGACRCGFAGRGCGRRRSPARRSRGRSGWR